MLFGRSHEKPKAGLFRDSLTGNQPFSTKVNPAPGSEDKPHTFTGAPLSRSRTHIDTSPMGQKSLTRVKGRRGTVDSFTPKVRNDDGAMSLYSSKHSESRLGNRSELENLKLVMRRYRDDYSRKSSSKSAFRSNLANSRMSLA